MVAPALTDEQVRDVFQAVADGWPTGIVARWYHVSPSTIRNVLCGKGHYGAVDVPPELREAVRHRRRRNTPPEMSRASRKLSRDDVRLIRGLRETQRTPLPALAAAFGVTTRTVWRVVHGKTHDDRFWEYISDDSKGANA